MYGDHTTVQLKSLFVHNLFMFYNTRRCEMTDICWFCKKNPADPTKTIEVPLYKTISKIPEHIQGDGLNMSGTRTTYTYNPAKVLIPRCGSCKEVHGKVGKFDAGVGLGIIVLLISVAGMAFLRSLRSLPLIIIPIICVVGAVIIIIVFNIKTKNYKRSLGTMILFDSAMEKKKYPEVSRLLGLGYEIGKSPTKPGF